MWQWFLRINVSEIDQIYRKPEKEIKKDEKE